MPTELDLRARLRLEVARLREHESRRRFAPTVYVGTPAGDRRALRLDRDQCATCDRQMRVDLLLGLLEAVERLDTTADKGSDSVWITRPGTTEPSDDDFGWLAAAVAAFGSADRPLAGCFAITREGWLDVGTGERRVWARLRLA